jgi:hypothetical protein
LKREVGVIWGIHTYITFYRVRKLYIQICYSKTSNKRGCEL